MKGCGFTMKTVEQMRKAYEPRAGEPRWFSAWVKESKLILTKGKKQ